jgi:hypothetical protein
MNAVIKQLHDAPAASESRELTVVDRARKALGSDENGPALVELVARTADITAIKNSVGRMQCHNAYMSLKTRRTDIRKAGKDARDDATKFSKAVIAEEDRLVSIIEPEETRLMNLRNAWDADREAERVARELADKARIADIRKKLDELRAIPVGLMDATPEQLTNAIADLEEFKATREVFGEFADEAHCACTEVVMKVSEMRSAAIRRAEEAAQLASERAELAKQRAEQDDRERQAAAERARVDGIKAKIAEIRERPAKLVGAPLLRVLSAIDETAELSEEPGEFAEFSQEAAEAKASTFDQLCKIRDTLIEQRNAANRLAAAQAEIAAQQAALDADRQRIADEAAARQQAEEEAAAAKVQVEADRIFAEHSVRVAADRAAEQARAAADTAKRNAAQAMFDALEKMLDCFVDDPLSYQHSSGPVIDAARDAIALACPVEATEAA